MHQLAFWNDHPDLSSPTPSEHGKADADGCRAAAAALQKHINRKHASANSMFLRPPTRKRLSEGTSLRKEAIRLERIQATLLRLAELHENGTIQPDLSKLTTRTAVESALLSSNSDSPIHTLYKSVARNESRKERVMRRTAEAATLGIPSYFPTPESVADRLVSMSCIEPGNRVLEPSAGTGNLVDAVLRAQQDCVVSYCELNCFLLEILQDKYERFDNVHFVGRDVCDLDSNRVERFDRIIMNPPFENGEDAQHINHAWCALLGAGGILTSVVSAGMFSRRDKKAQAFQEFLRDQRALVVDLPTGSFKSSGTGVDSKIVQLKA